MTFETYVGAWLEKQGFIKSIRKTTRQALEVYSFPVIGNKELTDIIDSDIDRIFYSVRLFNRKGDRQSFMHTALVLLTALKAGGRPPERRQQKRRLHS